MFAAGPRWLSSLYPSTVIEALVLPVVSTSHPLSGVPAACVLLVFLNSRGEGLPASKRANFRGGSVY